MSDPVAPQFIPGLRRDGSPDTRGLNDYLSGEVVDHVEIGAVDGEAVVARVVFQSGGVLFLRPDRVGRESLAAQRGAHWTTTFTYYPPKAKPGIIVPGHGVVTL